ncbi:MAG: hypothetical protein L6R39_003535 [Caloplaca ligustica]|nr:MAG: hypothetical protein L6R39_003535 [Caloplaca ligustica]
MNGILSTIFACGSRRERYIQLPTGNSNQHPSQPEKSTVDYSSEKTVHLTCEEAATRIVNTLFEANKDSPPLIAQIDGIAHQAGGWSEWLAGKTREGLEAALKAGKGMNTAVAAAYARACEAAKVFEHFAEDHPLATAVFVTVIAIGVLVILAPYVVELLGFGELGPIEEVRHDLEVKLPDLAALQKVARIDTEK